MAARGSGEHALRHLLAPFARARHPLEGRLQARVPRSSPSIGVAGAIVDLFSRRLRVGGRNFSHKLLLMGCAVYLSVKAAHCSHEVFVGCSTKRSKLSDC